MSTRAVVLEALRDVKDPELGMSIVELGLVKKVELDGSKVQVHIDLTIPACPLKDQIRASIEEAVAKVVKQPQLTLTMGAMTPAELEALRQRLGAQRSAAIGASPSTGSGQAPTAGKVGANAGGINLLNKKVPFIVAVGSGKGGVGKSSVTAQLACALQRLGKKVGILDADITGPSIARIFGSKDKPKVKPDEPDVIIPVDTASGVKILSMNLLIPDENAPVMWRGPLINGAIRQLYSNAAWEGLDVLFIDMPPGTSDATLTIYQSLPIDGVVIVTTPQALVGMIVAKSLSMAQTMRVPVFGLVENLAYVQVPERKEPFYLFGALKGEGAAKIFDVPYYGALAIDPALAQACDKGDIQSIADPRVAEMAQRLLEQAPAA